MLKVQEASLDWALSHALRYGDTDVFPVPFEYQAIEYDWQIARKSLREVDVLGWTSRPQRTLLSTKAKYGFRLITQLNPLDFLIYAALVREIAVEVETHRIPVSDNRVFSHRVAINDQGQLFDPDIGYREFLGSGEVRWEDGLNCSDE